jgi:nitroreductase
MAEFFSTIKARKSVRSYLPKQVEKQKLQQIAEAAFEGPNAGPVFVSVVTNAGLLKEIDDKAYAAMAASSNAFVQSRVAIPGYRPLYGAPALIVISAPKDGPFSSVNAAAATTSAAYAATALGLGSCYVMSPTLALNPDAELEQKVGVPEGSTTFVGLLVGYEGPPSIPGPPGPTQVNIKFFE